MSPGILEGTNPQQATPRMGPTPEMSMPAKVDPQMQERVDMFMANGLNLIHNKKISDSLVNIIKNAKNEKREPDPIQGIAEATLNVIDRLESSAGERGVTLPPEYIAEAGNALMGEIIQVAEASGLGPFSEQDKYTAFSKAVGLYLTQALKDGKITNEQLQEMSKQIQQTPEGKQIMAQMQPQQQQGPTQQGAPRRPPGGAPLGGV